MKQLTAGSMPISVRFSMTPTLIAPEVAKPLGWTLYYQKIGGGSPSTAQFKAAFDGVVVAPFAAALSAKFLAPSIFIRDMSLYANAEDVYLPGVNAAYVGTVAGDSLPPASAALIKKITGERGRQNRGFLHLPMVAETNTTDAGLTNAALALYQTLANALASTIVTAGVVATFAPSIYGTSESNPFLGTTGIWMEVITAMAASRTIKTVRRRAPKAIYV